MKKMHFIPALFSIAVLLAACSTTPTTTSRLDQARADYLAAQTNPTVAANAPLEFKAATDALDKANTAAAKRDSLETIDQLAYLAKQKIAIAQEVSKTKNAEAAAANAARQSDQMRLAERTQEANQARSSAEQARFNAEQAKAQADASRAQADAARMQAEAASSAAATVTARNAALEQQLAELNAKQTERGIIITFSDVLFNVDRAELSADGMRTAQKLADLLAQNPQGVVLVEGFTDSTGSPAHNLELSQRRAEAVRAALLGMGVGRERIATKGYGESYPVAGNDSAGNRQLNRRVEIVLSQNGAPIANRR
ncbi:MAG: OmpA family protein [Sphingomonadaceae bacterium]